MTVPTIECYPDEGPIIKFFSQDGLTSKELKVDNDGHVYAGDKQLAHYLVNIAIVGTDAPYAKTDNDIYTKVANLVFPGSDKVGSPEAMKVTPWMDSGPTGYDVRVFDVTNSNTICEKIGNTNIESDSIIDLGAMSNVPTEEACFEIQLRRNDGSYGNYIYISSLMILF